jgi:hypothetical protein
MMHVPEKYRVLTGPMATDASCGNNGAFVIPEGPLKRQLFIIAADGTEKEAGHIADGWEHVSVHAVSLDGKGSYVPMWAEMEYIARLFWDDEDTIIQLHPPRSRWINNHPNVLHLWRSCNHAIPLPPGALV